MKSHLFLAIFLLWSISSMAQINKGAIILMLDGNYNKSSNSFGVSTNQTSIEGNYLTLGTSAGLLLTDRWMLGIGVDYNRNKETRTSMMFINQYYQVEKSDIKSNALFPNIYVGYYYPIINKLYLSAKAKFSLSNITTDYNTLIAGRINNLSSFFIPIFAEGTLYSFTNERSTKTDYFSTSVIPELTWFFTSKLGLRLALGGIEYSILDWKSNNSQWDINFNPSHWSFGIQFIL